MDRLNHINLAYLWLAAVAAGAIAGGLYAAVDSLVRYTRDRGQQ